MSRRLLTVGLIAAALLAGRCKAKPPDLPLPQNDVLAPPAAAQATPYAFPPASALATESPLFFRVRPSVRRTVASCLLFCAHPLLALAPTEEYVDFDEEDTQPGTIQALFVSPASEEPSVEADAPMHHCTDFNIDAETGDAPPVAPTAESNHETPMAAVPFQPAGQINQFRPTRFISGIGPGGTLTNDLNIPIAPYSYDGDSTQSICPWMRQQQCASDHPTAVSADIDLSHDVLHNLEMLRLAQALVQTARESGGAGRVCDALECLELAHDLCPGSWLDRKIQEATAEVFAAAYCDSPQSHAAACLGKKKTAKEREIERKLHEPVTMHLDEVPLREVIDDLRASQNMNIYVDMPALDELGVSLDQPVTVQLEDVSLQSALHVILNPARLTFVVKDEIVQITTKHAASGQPVQNSGATEDAVRPCLPPVDTEIPAILDHLYPETTCPARPECGGEEQEPPADPKEEGVKNAPAPMSYLDMFDHGELSIGLDGSVRMFTQFRRGGSVWHLHYDDGGLSVWASPDGGADTPSPAENPPDDDSTD